MSSISIIIPFHRNKNMLKNSLNTLCESLDNSIKYEIIIVANNIDENEIELNLDPYKFKIISFTSNLFYPEAIRKGANVASGDYLILADPDIFYCEGWFENIMSSYLSNDSIGCVGAKLLNPNNNRVLDFGIGYQGYHTIHVLRGFPFNHELCSCDIEVQSVCSALLLVKHSLFDALNGMDNEMPYAYCDNDFCLRIREAGYKVVVSANSIVYHKGNTDSQNSKYYAFKYLREDSAAAFFYKDRAKYYNDYIQHLQRTYDYYKAVIKATGYIFINLSSMNDWKNYLSALKNMNIKVVDVYEYTVYERHASRLDFVDIINPLLIYTKTPIIYFVDTFLSYYENSLWFSLRNTDKDIIMDCNANLIPNWYIVNYLL